MNLPWRKNERGHSVFISLIVLFIASIVLVALHFLVVRQINAISALREEQEQAVRIFDIAVSIDEAIGGRENIVGSMEGLLPNLVSVGEGIRKIENGVSGLFTRQPEVRTLGTSVHPVDPKVQEVQFIITGRILESNIDSVLGRLDTLPILLEIREIRFNAAGPFSEEEGEVFYSGVVFARDE